MRLMRDLNVSPTVKKMDRDLMCDADILVWLGKSTRGLGEQVGLGKP